METIVKEDQIDLACQVECEDRSLLENSCSSKNQLVVLGLLLLAVKMAHLFHLKVGLTGLRQQPEHSLQLPLPRGLLIDLEQELKQENHLDPTGTIVPNLKP